MSELERAEALKAIQLELFQLKKDYKRFKSEHMAVLVQLSQLRRKQGRLLRQRSLVLNGGVKECRKCHEVMPVEQFYREARYADGYRSYCIECDLARMREYNAARRRLKAA